MCVNKPLDPEAYFFVYEPPTDVYSCEVLICFWRDFYGNFTSA